MRIKIEKMKWIGKILVLSVAILAGVGAGGEYYGGIGVVRADEVEELQKEIDELSHLRKLSEEATKPLESELQNIRQRVLGIQNQLRQADVETERLGKNIEERSEDLAESYQFLALRVRSYYMLSRQHSPIVSLLAAETASNLTKELSYRAAATGQDREAIIKTTEEILNLESDKDKLEARKTQLASLRGQFEKDAAFFEKEIAGAKEYQEELQDKIAELSAKQKAILSARSGTFTTSLGAVPLADDPKARPDYDPGFRPAFGGFSFGAWTHRKGMSQYGAKGRAEEGQSSDEILEAYYGKKPVEKDTGGSIKVEGVGEIDFEGKYLMGIAEMPASFPKEALKAQAIAARTYAYRYKKDGSTICTTQSCQVYLPSKAENPPEEWRKAVEETKGKIIEDVVTYYSSTTGGYLTEPKGMWDTTCGNESCWTDGAYEKIANSPWFYKGWYRSSYTNTSASCGRDHPWLTQEEMADIINAHLVLKKPNGADVDKIVPVTINECPIGGETGNPYSMGELKERANSSGGAVTSVASVKVSYGKNGQTSSVTFGTNRGSITIGGGDFKEAFNVRAPGYLSLRSPLYNIESK